MQKVLSRVWTGIGRVRISIGSARKRKSEIDYGDDWHETGLS